MTNSKSCLPKVYGDLALSCNGAQGYSQWLSTKKWKRMAEIILYLF